MRKWWDMDNNEYIDALNLTDESDLFVEVYNKVASSNASISIISNSDMINYMFRELISDNYECTFEVGNINFENINNDKNYILNIIDKNINIEPIDDNNSKLYKSSEIVFVDIDNVQLPILGQCMDNTENIIIFGFDIYF